MNNRANGFYWVKRKGAWVIAEYEKWDLAPDDNRYDWTLCGEFGMYKDFDFDEINETQLLPPKE